MTDRYEVEIIVFRHLDQARNTPEQPAVAQIVAASLPGLYTEAPDAPYVVETGPKGRATAPPAMAGDRKAVRLVANLL